MAYRCECEQRCKLRQNGWGPPHRTHVCPCCKTEFWIVDGKPTRNKPEEPKKKDYTNSQWDGYRHHWGV